jgi:mono/diheme cytochrome c family protein
MSSDVRKIIYGTLIAFIGVICLWIGLLFVVGCNGTLGCTKSEPTPFRTSIPTLAAATLPAPVEPTLGIGEPNESLVDIARPSVAGGPGQAVELLGNPVFGGKLFVQYCEACHGAEGKGGVPNPGTDDGVVPPLNPIDDTIPSPDYKIFATNVDLFIQHGSRPEGDAPAKVMPAWGDRNILTQQEIADLIAYVISLNP